MTFPTGGRRRWDPEDARPIDPLTDSASHRLMMGNTVRLHLHNEPPVEVALLSIRDVSTWSDLVARIEMGQALEVLGSRRRVFSGGVVLWAEVTTDPIEEPKSRNTSPSVRYGDAT